MARRKKKKRKLRYGLTEADMKHFAAHHREKCPRCEGHVCTIALSYAWWKECNDCGHVWGWANARGTPITKAEAERKCDQHERAWVDSSPKMSIIEGGDEMGKRKTKKSKKTGRKGATKKAAREKSRDARLPKVGATIRGSYKGKDYEAKIVKDGVEYQGKIYGSVSSAGTAITKKTCNGYVFFGLNDGTKKKAPRAAVNAEATTKPRTRAKPEVHTKPEAEKTVKRHKTVTRRKKS